MATAVTAIAVAHARIIDCNESSQHGQPTQYVAFLDEPEYTPAAFASRDEMLRFLARLQWQLDQARDEKWIQSSNAAVHFANCVNRTPAFDGQDFNDPRLVESLYNQGVLIEIWGRLDAQKQGGRSVNQQALINFLLVPLRFATNTDASLPTGFHRIAYPERSSSPTNDFVQLIARSTDIDAFIAVSLGIKAMREKNYENAHANLCQANLLLKQVATRLPRGQELTSIDGLRSFVNLTAGRAVSAAQMDPAHTSPGLLQLQLYDAKAPCAGTGVRP
ncbi:hypothetical protein DID96_25415 [Burkholderia sp. Bp8963]|uniref:hypothetical protein n=1 Tax=Burkholderia sp. Bp8963 TaxID=2184547 RepID=UPI000F5940B9|nr:hypothetical protein [Burkholderia sp. Bp8963]RQS65768.1 hypothetical protein DID96_25415 [Burkholderia sp. Bp8963]